MLHPGAERTVCVVALGIGVLRDGIGLVDTVDLDEGGGFFRAAVDTGGQARCHGCAEAGGLPHFQRGDRDAENVGFAITINEAKGVIDDLVSKGYVTGRPILGITCLQVSEYVAAVQGMTPGLYVTDIDRSLAIAQSDLKVGDTITEINGESVTSTSEVSSLLNGMKPGDTVTATVVRADSLGRNKELKIDIVLSEYNGS